MPLFATKYEILRGVSSTSFTPCKAQPSGKPVRVGLLLDEQKFVESGGLISHLGTLFLDDLVHDWDWRDGVFFYYGHGLGLKDVGDIVVILAQEVRDVAPK